MRHIPATMATQHPDNSSSPEWREGDTAFVSAQEELKELLYCFTQLGTEEYMWDWEGKHADEAVIDRLFSEHYKYFKKHHLGKEIFLTFRIPNVWQEKGYSLMRALMVILTSEDFAKDLGFHPTPLFEAILPMTEKPDQLMYIQKAFSRLSQLKTKIFNHRKDDNSNYLELIPLSEGIKHQLGLKRLLQDYIGMHKSYFGKRPEYLRPFIARSDPAMMSGSITTALANKIALSDMYDFAQASRIEVYPIIGVGSLPFRGGLNPEHVEDFVKQHAGVRTVTIQSAFRYDYPADSARVAVEYLKKHLPKAAPQIINSGERKKLASMILRAEKIYQNTMPGTLKIMNPVFNSMPKRRERRQHIGLLAYSRKLGAKALPRAIGFTGSFYSIGVPPEFIGLGRFLASLSATETGLVERYYFSLRQDMIRAGNFLNKENLQILAKQNKGFEKIKKDVSLAEKFFGLEFGPGANEHYLHKNLSSNAWLLRHKPEKLHDLITETGVLRKSLG